MQTLQTEQPIDRLQVRPLVLMSDISKAFPGCLANDRVSLELHAGVIHALLGENGAGKSTLVKILYGLVAPDSGTVVWQGRKVQINSPAMARELGIAMVFQHFSLFESLTVLENIALGMAGSADRELATRITEVSARYGLPLEPDIPVYSLSVGERQRIEIVRCLLQEPKLLIMDEPTSVLTPQEAAQLFETLKTLAAGGMAILYISHKLDEIRQLCSQATVLRQGRCVADTDPRQETVGSLAALMMGHDIDSPSTRSAVEPVDERQPLLELRNLSQAPVSAFSVPLKQINLAVAPGEIVGIAGVAGNGQDELMATIIGEQALTESQSLLLNGKTAGRLNPGQRREQGLCCVPEARMGHAAVPDLSLSENVFLTAHRRQSLHVSGLILRRRSRQLAQQVISTFQVQCSGPDALARSLSGGNLQKFIVGREILQSPRVLVISQPTWGVDAGAAVAIHEAIKTLADSGCAVLIISQDLDELLLITDRIAALCAGTLSRTFQTSDVTAQQMGILMGGEEAL